MSTAFQIVMCSTSICIHRWGTKHLCYQPVTHCILATGQVMGMITLDN